MFGKLREGMHDLTTYLRLEKQSLEKECLKHNTEKQNASTLNNKKITLRTEYPTLRDDLFTEGLSVPKQS